MARPDNTVYAEPSARVLSTWSPPQVRRVLEQLLRGDYASAGALADAVLADDRVQATLGTRINGLLGLPLTFTPADDTPAAKRASELLEADWWRIADEATLTEWLTYGLLVGACLAELVWDTAGERSLPRLKVWHPSNVRLQDGAWQVRLEGERWMDVTPGDGKWALLAPYGERRAGTRALLRAVAIPWLSKNFALADWNRAGEVWGGPTRVGKAPVGASDTERRAFRDDLASLAHSSSVVLPEGWDVELLEGKPGTGELHERLVDWADKAIAITVLGQNLTTDVQGGSLAAAEVHENVRSDLKQNDDHVLSTTSREEVIVWWAEFNLGDRRLAPWPERDTTPPADEAATAQAFSTSAQALLTLSTAAQQTGLPVDWPALAEKVGIPLVAGAPLAAPRFPAGERFAGLRLASGDRLDTARGFARGQLYADALSEHAAGQGAAATRPLLERVLELVQSATSYEGLREALLSEFAHLDVEALAELTESSVVLAGLAGRLAVIDDA